MNRKILALALLLSALPFFSASAMIPYEVHWGGLHVASVHLKMIEKNGITTASTDIRSQGLLDVVYSFAANYQSQFTKEKTLDYTGSFTRRGKQDARSWMVEKDKITITEGPTDRVKPGLLVGNIIDPLAVFTKLPQDTANGQPVSYKVFDGKHLFDITGKDLGLTEKRILNRHVKGREIALTIDPVAGIKKRDLKRWAASKINVLMTPEAPHQILQIWVESSGTSGVARANNYIKANYDVIKRTLPGF